MKKASNTTPQPNSRTAAPVNAKNPSESYHEAEAKLFEQVNGISGVAGKVQKAIERQYEATAKVLSQVATGDIDAEEGIVEDYIGTKAEEIFEKSQSKIKSLKREVALKKHRGEAVSSFAADEIYGQILINSGYTGVLEEADAVAKVEGLSKDLAAGIGITFVAQDIQKGIFFDSITVANEAEIKSGGGIEGLRDALDTAFKNTADEPTKRVIANRIAALNKEIEAAAAKITKSEKKLETSNATLTESVEARRDFLTRNSSKIKDKVNDPENDLKIEYQILALDKTLQNEWKQIVAKLEEARGQVKAYEDAIVDAIIEQKGNTYSALEMDSKYLADIKGKSAQETVTYAALETNAKGTVDERDVEDTNDVKLVESEFKLNGCLGIKNHYPAGVKRELNESIKYEVLFQEQRIAELDTVVVQSQLEEVQASKGYNKSKRELKEIVNGTNLENLTSEKQGLVSATLVRDQVKLGGWSLVQETAEAEIRAAERKQLLQYKEMAKAYEVIVASTVIESNKTHSYVDVDVEDEATYEYSVNDTLSSCHNAALDLDKTEKSFKVKALESALLILENKGDLKDLENDLVDFLGEPLAKDPKEQIKRALKLTDKSNLRDSKLEDIEFAKGRTNSPENAALVKNKVIKLALDLGKGETAVLPQTEYSYLFKENSTTHAQEPLSKAELRDLLEAADAQVTPEQELKFNEERIAGLKSDFVGKRETFLDFSRIAGEALASQDEEFLQSPENFDNVNRNIEGLSAQQEGLLADKNEQKVYQARLPLVKDMVLLNRVTQKILNKLDEVNAGVGEGDEVEALTHEQMEEVRGALSAEELEAVTNAFEDELDFSDQDVVIGILNAELDKIKGKIAETVEQQEAVEDTDELVDYIVESITERIENTSHEISKIKSDYELLCKLEEFNLEILKEVSLEEGDISEENNSNLRVFAELNGWQIETNDELNEEENAEEQLASCIEFIGELTTKQVQSRKDELRDVIDSQEIFSNLEDVSWVDPAVLAANHLQSVSEKEVEQISEQLGDSRTVKITDALVNVAAAFSSLEGARVIVKAQGEFINGVDPSSEKGQEAVAKLKKLQPVSKLATTVQESTPEQEGLEILLGGRASLLTKAKENTVAPAVVSSLESSLKVQEASFSNDSVKEAVAAEEAKRAVRSFVITKKGETLHGGGEPDLSMKDEDVVLKDSEQDGIKLARGLKSFGDKHEMLLPEINRASAIEGKSSEFGASATLYFEKVSDAKAFAQRLNSYQEKVGNDETGYSVPIMKDPLSVESVDKDSKHPYKGQYSVTIQVNTNKEKSLKGVDKDQGLVFDTTGDLSKPKFLEDVAISQEANKRIADLNEESRRKNITTDKDAVFKQSMARAANIACLGIPVVPAITGFIGGTAALLHKGVSYLPGSSSKIFGGSEILASISQTALEASAAGFEQTNWLSFGGVGKSWSKGLRGISNTVEKVEEGKGNTLGSSSNINDNALARGVRSILGYDEVHDVSKGSKAKAVANETAEFLAIGVRAPALALSLIPNTVAFASHIVGDLGMGAARKGWEYANDEKNNGVLRGLAGFGSLLTGAIAAPARGVGIVTRSMGDMLSKPSEYSRPEDTVSQNRRAMGFLGSISRGLNWLADAPRVAINDNLFPVIPVAEAKIVLGTEKVGKGLSEADLANNEKIKASNKKLEVALAPSKNEDNATISPDKFKEFFSTRDSAATHLKALMGSKTECKIGDLKVKIDENNQIYIKDNKDVTSSMMRWTSGSSNKEPIKFDSQTIDPRLAKLVAALVNSTAKLDKDGEVNPKVQFLEPTKEELAAKAAKAAQDKAEAAAKSANAKKPTGIPPKANTANTSKTSSAVPPQAKANASDTSKTTSRTSPVNKDAPAQSGDAKGKETLPTRSKTPTSTGTREAAAPTKVEGKANTAAVRTSVNSLRRPPSLVVDRDTKPQNEPPKAPPAVKGKADSLFPPKPPMHSGGVPQNYKVDLDDEASLDTIRRMAPVPNTRQSVNLNNSSFNRQPNTVARSDAPSLGSTNRRSTVRPPANQDYYMGPDQYEGQRTSTRDTNDRQTRDVPQYQPPQVQVGENTSTNNSSAIRSSAPSLGTRNNVAPSRHTQFNGVNSAGNVAEAASGSNTNRGIELEGVDVRQSANVRTSINVAKAVNGFQKAKRAGEPAVKSESQNATTDRRPSERTEYRQHEGLGSNNVAPDRHAQSQSNVKGFAMRIGSARDGRKSDKWTERVTTASDDGKSDDGKSDDGSVR